MRMIVILFLCFFSVSSLAEVLCEREEYRVALATEGEEVVLMHFCMQPRFEIADVPSFAGCAIRPLQASRLNIVARFECLGISRDYVWKRFRHCRSIAIAREGHEDSTRIGLEARAQAAEVCGDTELANTWRARKKTWVTR